MEKEKITLQELWKENGVNFTIMSGGYVDSSPEPLTHQVNRPTADDEDELLLPAGQTLESEDEKNQKHIQRNISREEEPLYPVGINPNSK